MDLNDLFPAKAQGDDTPKPPAIERSRKSIAAVRKQTMARLVAQEYVRNGMNLIDAYNAVNHTAYVPNGQTMYRLLGKATDDFMDELNRLLARSDISRERALAILWTMINTSILDFLDEHGNILSVKELKKLPRTMQLLLSKISVESHQSVALDPTTKKPMLDDLGRPYLTTHAKVRIEIPDKLVAFRQLAEVMRWVGPTVQVNNFVSVGVQMAEADARARRMDRVYEGTLVEPKE